MAKKIEQILLENEKMIAMVPPSKETIAYHIFIALLFIIGFGLAATKYHFLIGGIVFGLFGLFYSISSVFTDRLILTDKRIIFTTGIIKPFVDSVELSEILNLYIEQTEREKKFNCGSIMIATTGNLVATPPISKPDEFINKIIDELEKIHGENSENGENS